MTPAAAPARAARARPGPESFSIAFPQQEHDPPR